MPRKRKLTDEQARELLRRYYLGRENRAWKLCKDFGINNATLFNYIHLERAKRR